MSEIIKELIHTDEGYLIITPDHTVSDIVRYLVQCSGITEVRYLLDELEKDTVE